MFKIGQKVVCVNTNVNKPDLTLVGITKGNIT